MGDRANGGGGGGFFCCARPQAPVIEGGLIFINGQHYCGKTTACKFMKKAYFPRALLLAEDQMYFPKEEVPKSRRHCDLRGNAKKLASHCKELADEGRLVIIEQSDRFGLFMQDATEIYPGAVFPVLSVFLYLPLPAIFERVQSARVKQPQQQLFGGPTHHTTPWDAFVEYACLVRGTAEKTPRSLEKLTRTQVDEAFFLAAHHCPPIPMGQGTAATVVHAVKSFVLNLLHFGADLSVTELWIEPRNVHDLVMNVGTSTPKQVSSKVYDTYIEVVAGETLLYKRVAPNEHAVEAEQFLVKAMDNGLPSTHLDCLQQLQQLLLKQDAAEGIVAPAELSPLTEVAPAFPNGIPPGPQPPSWPPVGEWQGGPSGNGYFNGAQQNGHHESDEEETEDRHMVYAIPKPPPPKPKGPPPHLIKRKAKPPPRPLPAFHIRGMPEGYQPEEPPAGEGQESDSPATVEVLQNPDSSPVQTTEGEAVPTGASECDATTLPAVESSPPVVSHEPTQSLQHAETVPVQGDTLIQPIEEQKAPTGAGVAASVGECEVTGETSTHSIQDEPAVQHVTVVDDVQDQPQVDVQQTDANQLADAEAAEPLVESPVSEPLPEALPSPVEPQIPESTAEAEDLPSSSRAAETVNAATPKKTLNVDAEPFYPAWMRVSPDRRPESF
eukprot:TRINITY_DN14935_c0_g1_i1.p1 TRINITY_DN14935_c0_g1~~TRINITY_DN14935_c0_g1_i1.p1  ORF type:complete len:666 (+),score=108.40 TRINITY_DN14935_c0_g1_i1:146-2143(+)